MPLKSRDFLSRSEILTLISVYAIRGQSHAEVRAVIEELIRFFNATMMYNEGKLFIPYSDNTVEKIIILGKFSDYRLDMLRKKFVSMLRDGLK